MNVEDVKLGQNGHNGHLIDLREVVKTYETGAGSFTALKGIDLRVDEGEFLAVGNPAPPRPLSPETFISSMTSSGVMDVRTLAKA